MNSNNVTPFVYEQCRKRMIRKQIQKRGICDQVVLNAMLNVPRHLFMRADMTSRSYHDQAAPIDCQQTISQPYIVALMTELLELDSQSHVLEIGTGSGYQTAVLAEIVDKVYILNEGSIFFEGDPSEAIKDEKIKKFYLGLDFNL